MLKSLKLLNYGSIIWDLPNQGLAINSLAKCAFLITCDCSVIRIQSQSPVVYSTLIAML